MATLLAMIASAVEGIAVFGAGAASIFIGFEPEIPEELK